MARACAAIVCAFFLAAGAVSAAPQGGAIARRASGLVGHHSLREVVRGFSDDCSGLVRYVYSRSGIELLPPGVEARGGASAAIHHRLQRLGALRRRAARPGDLVFFHDTYDRNRDGRRNDGVTHVGIVESVAQGGQVTFVHRTRAGIVRSRLDLRQPLLQRDRAGRVHNDVLRRASRGQRAFNAGELFAGFATPPRRVPKRPAA